MAWRYIKKNKACQSPQAMLFFDTETRRTQNDKHGKRWSHLLRFGHARYLRMTGARATHKRSLDFTKPSEFWSFVASCVTKHRTLWAFAHNALFDLRVCDIKGVLPSEDWRISAKKQTRKITIDGKSQEIPIGLCVLQTPPTILCLEHLPSGGRVVFLDTLNYFPLPLRDIGSMVGLEKLVIDFADCTDEELAVYCRRDVEIIEAAVVTLVNWSRDNDLGNFKWTIAGNAMNCFRHRFMKHSICIHDDIEAKKIERAAYYGGQTQCFVLGELREPVYMLDVRSMYPSVMRHNLYPVKLTGLYDAMHDGKVPDESQLLHCIAQVRIKSDEATYPIRREFGLDYVCGDFWTTLCGPELVGANTRGHIADWRKWCSYSLADIFTEYVDYFWSKRRYYELSDNLTFAKLCKVYLNSLYGVWGMLTAEWESVPGVEPINAWDCWPSDNQTTGEVEYWRSVGNLAQKQGKRVDHARSFCAVSAFVTSYGREKMRALREVAYATNVMYQGTDSLIVNQAGYDNLAAAGELADNCLGKMNDKFCADYLCVRAKNQLQIGEQLIVSGMKASALQIDRETYSQICFGGLSQLFVPQTQSEPVEYSRRVKLTPIGDYDDGTSYVRPAPRIICDLTGVPF